MPYGSLVLDQIQTSGNLQVSGNVTAVGTLAATNFSSANSLGMRNRIINGAMAIDQRNAGAAQTITAAAALAYTVDRWYAYCTGANVTGQRVAGTGANQFAYRFTGASSVTGIGFGQRIEASNCFDLAGSTATLSVELANTLLTTVTWTAFYANTADTFGTLASPTRTQIATGTFTVNSTLTRYSTNISIPAAATTGIEIVFTVGAQTSGTWTIDNVQLEAGTVATPFERRPIASELFLCQRYYQKSYALDVAPGTNTGTNNSGYIEWNWGAMTAFATVTIPLRTTLRASPTFTSYSLAGVLNGYAFWNGSTTVQATGTINGFNLGTNTVTWFMDGTSRSNLQFHWTVSSEL